MLVEESWLSLRISESGVKNLEKSPVFFISVPRKIVRLATERNRIKRLIREAVRLNPEFKSAGKVLYFSVRKKPKRPNLEDVKKQLFYSSP